MYGHAAAESADSFPVYFPGASVALDQVVKHSDPDW